MWRLVWNLVTWKLQNMYSESFAWRADVLMRVLRVRQQAKKQISITFHDISDK